MSAELIAAIMAELNRQHTDSSLVYMSYRPDQLEGVVVDGHLDVPALASALEYRIEAMQADREMLTRMVNTQNRIITGAIEEMDGIGELAQRMRAALTAPPDLPDPPPALRIVP